MRVDHRRADVPVSQEFLHRPDIVTVLEEMGREAVPQAVTSGALGDFGPNHRRPKRSLNDGFVEMAPVNSGGARLRMVTRSRKDPLPTPLTLGSRILPVEPP